MPRTLAKKDVDTIISLREHGHSLPEIRKITGKPNGTVFKYIQGVAVLPEFLQILKEKQGGSKSRSLRNWQVAAEETKRRLGTPFTDREKLLILSSLYWGEGTKTELNIINSDSALLRVVVDCLKSLGVRNEDFKINLRVFSDCDQEKAVAHWVRELDLPQSQMQNINILEGKKQGKLIYGMCRLRVTKGDRYFKLIMSVIDLMKSNIQ